ncbi:exocyst complex component EXO70E2-like [Phragmites australis]|uniref:exocyst complex component EXO70E2-like n=1 Tax=Phragmites australis TaxID=29695 RepID=UPI002D77C9A4|nr:exocyst complex component EXO70E2-like [Phragmites australis]
MMQYGGGTSGMLLAPALGSVRFEYTPLSTYRDSIRRVAVSGGLCRSAQFLPPSRDTAAGEGSSYSGSSGSSASSPASDASARCSPRSLSFSSDGDLSFSDWWVAAPDWVQELRAIALQMVHDGYMKDLIRAFGGGRSFGALRAPPGCWFRELDVEWVLHIGKQGDIVQLQLQLEDGCASLQDLMERWIKALKTMVQVLCITQLELRAKRPTVGGVKKSIQHFLLLATGKMAERDQEVSQFTRFAEASILRMLAFVDAVAAAALNDHQAPETLPGMLQVYTCIVDDSPTVLALFKEASSTSMFDAMNAVFLQKRNKLSDAIWSMMEKVRASFLRDDRWRVSPEVGGVHKTTRLTMNYIMLLSRNEGALNFILQDLHRFEMLLSKPDYYSSSVLNLIKDMISCLEKQLEKTSNFISDPGLRYIFLMNNCSFIWQKVSSLLLPSWTPIEDYKIQTSRKRDSRERLTPMEDYVNQPDPNLAQQIETDSNMDGLVRIQSYIGAYLDASWEPVLSCLYHDIPHCFQRCGGVLAKFESEFERTYATQKLWKVPNPELRKRLRKAVIEKVISGYNKYLADRTERGKSNRPSTRTPHELEELLEELFEG